MAAFAGVTLATLGAGYASLRNRGEIWDERFHARHVESFSKGRFGRHHMLTTLPGYHFVMAGVARIAGRSDLAFLRLGSAAFGAGCVALFWGAFRRLHEQGDLPAAGQLLFLPVVFPFFFLAYTDVFGLLLVCLALFCWAAGHPHLAAWAAIASIGVRQDNVIWLVLLCWVLLSNPRGRGWRDAGTALAGLGAFAVFVFFNQGVAFGDRRAHPFPSFHLGNVYMALWLLFLLFPFLHADNARGAFARLRADRRLWLLPAGLLVFSLLTFRNTHPYNQTGRFIHNWVLVHASSSLAARALFVLPVVLALLSLLATPLRAGTALPFYACAFLGLGAHWLVEPRYSIVPFTLFLLLREPRNARVEWATVLWLAAGSAALLWAIATRRAFP